MKKAPYHRLVVTVFSRVAWAKPRSFGPFLRPHFAGCRSFLDVGCGDGIVTRHLMDTHPRNEFVGLDGIDYRVTDIPMELYNGLQFPFPDRHFDCVYAISCLHHCSDENAVLREMIRVARTRLIVVEEIYDGRMRSA